MNVTHLHCSACNQSYEPRRLYNLCVCGKPLLVAYDLDRAATTLTRAALATRPPTLWRYEEVLPLSDPANRVSLGEGMTPLLKAERLGQQLGLKHLYIKDESQNPTASFKARGMTAAVSMAKELGVKSSPCPQPEMPPVRSLPTLPKLASKRLSSCHETRPKQTSSNASRTALI